MPTPPLAIDYAPPARRRWPWRRVVLFTFIALTLAAGIYCRHRIAHEARLWYWQRQCLNYTRPPGTLAVTNKPSAANDPDYVVPLRLLQSLNVHSECYLRPACLKNLDTETSGSIHGLQYMGDPPQILFLHERISPSGHRRLVLVENVTANALSITSGMIPRVIVPGTIWSPARELSEQKLLEFSGRYIEAQFYFGQPDPSDASHFTIDFDVKEHARHGTIDAWLNDDETVTFKLRNPATTRGL